LVRYLERAAFAINAVVLQELLLARNGAAGNLDLSAAVSDLEVVAAGADLASPEFQAELRSLRNHLVHANDVLILAAARSCDVLLTERRGRAPARLLADAEACLTAILARRSGITSSLTCYEVEEALYGDGAMRQR
jgi:hypothetical protein